MVPVMDVMRTVMLPFAGRSRCMKANRSLTKVPSGPVMSAGHGPSQEAWLPNA